VGNGKKEKKKKNDINQGMTIKHKQRWCR